MNDGSGKGEDCCERNLNVFKSKICPKNKVQGFCKSFDLYPNFEEFNCLSVNPRVPSEKKNSRGFDISMLRKNPNLEGSSTSGSTSTIKNTDSIDSDESFNINNEISTNMEEGYILESNDFNSKQDGADDEISVKSSDYLTRDIENTADINEQWTVELEEHISEQSSIDDIVSINSDDSSDIDVKNALALEEGWVGEPEIYFEMTRSEFDKGDIRPIDDLEFLRNRKFETIFPNEKFSSENKDDENVPNYLSYSRNVKKFKYKKKCKNLEAPDWQINAEDVVEEGPHVNYNEEFIFENYPGGMRELESKTVRSSESPGCINIHELIKEYHANYYNEQFISKKKTLKDLVYRPIEKVKNVKPLEGCININAIEEEPHINYNKKSTSNSKLERVLKFELLEEADLHEKVKENCINMNIKKFRPIQKIVVPLILKTKNDLIVFSRPGSGKTFSYLIPVLSEAFKKNVFQKDKRYPKFLILVPDDIIGQGIFDFAVKLSGKSNCSPIVSFGTMFEGSNSHQMELLKHVGCDILIVSTERFMELLYKRRNQIKIHNVHTIIIDETNKLIWSRYKNTFDLSEVQARADPAVRTIIFSSNYFPLSTSPLKKFKQLKDGYLKITGNLENFDSHVRHYFKDCRKISFLKVILDETLEKSIYEDEEGEKHIPKIIIFSEDSSKIKFISRFLNIQARIRNINSNTVILTNDSNPATKLKNLRKFKKNDENSNILISEGYSKGIDYPRISLIINLEIPKNKEEYLNRISRISRTGDSGDVVNLISNDLNEEEKEVLKSMMDIAEASGSHVLESLRRDLTT